MNYGHVRWSCACTSADVMSESVIRHVKCSCVCTCYDREDDNMPSLSRQSLVYIDTGNFIAPFGLGFTWYLSRKFFFWLLPIVQIAESMPIVKTFSKVLWSLIKPTKSSWLINDSLTSIFLPTSHNFYVLDFVFVDFLNHVT